VSKPLLRRSSDGAPGPAPPTPSSGGSSRAAVGRRPSLGHQGVGQRAGQARRVEGLTGGLAKRGVPRGLQRVVSWAGSGWPVKGLPVGRGWGTANGLRLLPAPAGWWNAGQACLLLEPERRTIVSWKSLSLRSGDRRHVLPPSSRPAAVAPFPTGRAGRPDG